MNEERKQKYIELIEKLLSCSSYEESRKITADKANFKFFDADFVQMLETTAQMKSKDGDEFRANFLRVLASSIREALGPLITADIKRSLESLKKAEYQPYGQFLAKVLQATEESKGDAQVVYPLLKANINKLDASLEEVLRRWATNFFEEAEASEAEAIAVAIGTFSGLIRKFPLGSKAINVEIAITGYEVILTFLTEDNGPDLWAAVQNQLAGAYLERE